jgi:glycosyltransferase involved in cell wall biosynthesis
LIARMNMGGPARHVSLLTGMLDPARYESVLVTGHLGPGEGSAEGLAADYGARLERLPSMGPEMRPGSDARAFAQLVALIRRFRPAIVETHTAKAGFLGRMAAAVAVRPRPVVIHTFHGHVLEGYFSPAVNLTYRRLEQACARISDALVGVSQATVDDLVRLRVAPREKFRVIPLGLDLGPFAQVDDRAVREFREEVGAQPGEVLCGLVGRLVPIKRCDIAFRAVARARTDGARLRLVVVGDGELRADLERLAGELGIGHAVSFTGFRSDMPVVMTAVDIALLTSDNEGTPVALIEAAAAGRPAVATAVGGVRDVVGDDCGITVPAGDEVEVAKALVALAADEPRRAAMGARAREHVVGRFSVGRMLDEMDHLYQELLARRQSGLGRRLVRPRA